MPTGHQRILTGDVIAADSWQQPQLPYGCLAYLDRTQPKRPAAVPCIMHPSHLEEFCPQDGRFIYHIFRKSWSRPSQPQRGWLMAGIAIYRDSCDHS